MMKRTQWVRQTFSDGEKPSLARQLIALVIVVVLVLLTLHALFPSRIRELGTGMLDRVLNLLESLMMWAGWSRGMTAVKAVRFKTASKDDEP